MSKPLLKATLSPKQWEEINYIYEALKAEYEMRRSMLLVRLDVTIQSFKWAKKVGFRLTLDPCAVARGMFPSVMCHVVDKKEYRHNRTGS